MTSPIIKQVEKFIEKTPTKNALIFQEKVLTYRELGEKINSLSHSLSQRGISRGESREERYWGDGEMGKGVSRKDTWEMHRVRRNRDSKTTRDRKNVWKEKKIKKGINIYIERKNYTHTCPVAIC